jgi:hypothetical protein
MQYLRQDLSRKKLSDYMKNMDIEKPITMPIHRAENKHLYEKENFRLNFII